MNGILCICWFDGVKIRAMLAPVYTRGLKLGNIFASDMHVCCESRGCGERESWFARNFGRASRQSTSCSNEPLTFAR